MSLKSARGPRRFRNRVRDWRKLDPSSIIRLEPITAAGPFVTPNAIGKRTIKITVANVIVGLGLRRDLPSPRLLEFSVVAETSYLSDDRARRGPPLETISRLTNFAAARLSRIVF